MATRLQDRLKTREAEDNDDAEPLDDVLARLNALVGVEDVKREVATAISMYRVQQERIRRGLPAEGQSRHMVMLGPPGTGKTTVARLVAQAYRSLGSLRKGHIVECDRTDLVGEYLGQTGPKTNDKVDEALGGVLFIDEAYSLTLKQGDMYGDEAIAALDSMLTNSDPNTLLQLAEGYRELGRADRMESALLRLSQVMPEHPETWLNLAMVQASLGKTTEANATLENCFRLSDARLAKNPKAENIRTDFQTNSRYDQARAWFKGK